MNESRTTHMRQELQDVPMTPTGYRKFLSNHKKDMHLPTLASFFNDYLASHPDLTVPEIIRRSNLSGNYAHHLLPKSFCRDSTIESLRFRLQTCVRGCKTT